MVQFFDFHGAIEGKGFFDAWRAIAPVILALLGFFAIAVLEKKKVKDSVIITIASVTVLYYLATWQLPEFNLGKVGQTFVDFGSIGILGAFQGFSVFSGGFSSIVNAIVLIITFCLVDMFDTIGTLYGTAAQADMLDENGDPQDIDKAMTCGFSGDLLGRSARNLYLYYLC